MKSNDKVETLEDKSNTQEVETPKTFNDIISENSLSNKKEVKTPVTNIDNVSSDKEITDDQYFDDFFQDE